MIWILFYMGPYGPLRFLHISSSSICEAWFMKNIWLVRYQEFMLLKCKFIMLFKGDIGLWVGIQFPCLSLDLTLSVPSGVLHDPSINLLLSHLSLFLFFHFLPFIILMMQTNVYFASELLFSENWGRNLNLNICFPSTGALKVRAFAQTTPIYSLFGWLPLYRNTTYAVLHWIIS